MTALVSIQPHTSHNRDLRFGRLSLPSLSAFEAEVARNEVLSRVAVEAIGYTPWRMALARNKFERLEGFMDSFVWMVMGFALPIMIQTPIVRWYNKKLSAQFKLKNKQPLNIGLEWLDKSKIATLSGKKALAERMGLKSIQRIPTLAQKLLYIKLGLIFIDLACMSGKQFTYYWGRNKFTEWASQKKGFSGEFNIATDKQLEKNSSDIAASETFRKRVSLTSGLLYPIALPAVLLALLTRKTKPGAKNMLGAIKSLVPAFNYHRAIYMSKWIVFWNCLMGWNLIGLMSARDKHERREHLIRCGVVDFFFFIGDDIFAGMAGRYFQNKYKKQLGNIKLYKSWHGIPIGRGLDDMVFEAQKSGKKTVMNIVNKVGRWQFRIGLLTTALFLGLGTTAVNNWFTRQKVLREQQAGV